MNDNDCLDPGEVQSFRRALAALPARQRAMVLRMARVLLAAGDAPAPVRRPRLVLATEGAAVASPEACDDTPDELTRTAARRILARHGHGDDAA